MAATGVAVGVVLAVTCGFGFGVRPYLPGVRPLRPHRRTLLPSGMTIVHFTIERTAGSPVVQPIFLLTQRIDSG